MAKLSEYRNQRENEFEDCEFAQMTKLVEDGSIVTVIAQKKVDKKNGGKATFFTLKDGRILYTESMTVCGAFERVPDDVLKDGIKVKFIKRKSTTSNKDVIDVIDAGDA